MVEPLFKTYNELESVQFYGKFSNFGQQNMIGCQRKRFDMRHHVHLHALLKNLMVRVFQFAFPTFNAMWNLEAPKPLIDSI